MTAPKILRALGALDVVGGIAGIAAAGWFGDQLGFGSATIRIAAAALLVLGVDTLLMAEKPFMAKVSMVTEALCALVAVDLAVLGDATGTGVAILVVTAVACAAASVELALTTRTKQLVTA